MSPNAVLVLGDGSAKITLNAGGDIRVTNDADAGNSAEDFGNFAGMNFDWSGFGERISRQVEQATARAAKRAEEAARRVERHAERQARRWRGQCESRSLELGYRVRRVFPRRLRLPPSLWQKKNVWRF